MSSKKGGKRENFSSPHLILARLVGRYFGKKGARLDPYGVYLVSFTLLGGGHLIPHNELQSLLQNIMSVAVIWSEKEAVNFLLGTVPEPYIISYVNHIASYDQSRKVKDAIV